MNNQEKQKLNEKLARWVGFIKAGVTSTCKWWEYPNKGMGDLPNFTDSLDACFKWLVMKLPEGASLDMVAWDGYYDVTLWQRGIKPSGIEIAQCNIYAREYSQESLAEALCRVIEKLIDKEEIGDVQA